MDTMYDKYDIPYYTIWPLALQKGLDLACDGVSAIYLGNIRWTSSYSVQARLDIEHTDGKAYFSLAA